MIIIELPVVYAKNYKEIDKGNEAGIDIEPEESIDMTTFIIPENCLIRINESTEETRTSIFLDSEFYLIESDYETTIDLFKMAIKKQG